MLEVLVDDEALEVVDVLEVLEDEDVLVRVGQLEGVKDEEVLRLVDVVGVVVLDGASTGSQFSSLITTTFDLRTPTAGFVFPVGLTPSCTESSPGADSSVGCAEPSPDPSGSWDSISLKWLSTFTSLTYLTLTSSSLFFSNAFSMSSPRVHPLKAGRRLRTSVNS